MNVELLREVKEAILKDSAHFDMGYFACKTTGCIAAHAVRIARSIPFKEMEKLSNSAIAQLASEVLEVDLYQRSLLFYKDHWPAKYRKAYDKASIGFTGAGLKNKLARIAAERIDHFIATEGRTNEC